MNETTPNLQEIQNLAVAHLFGRKAQEVVLVDLRGRSGLCDWFVVATCQSEPQLDAILTGVRRDLRKAGHSALCAEAGKGARWGVLDYGDILIHVLLAEAREYYALERLWKDAPQIECLPENYPLPEKEAKEEEEILPLSEEEWT
ncbi:MAG: ribosome silencing factor [Fibrobacteria bacterium]|nr:ribosome silencing factor [Fibrobacteria bacterium]